MNKHEQSPKHKHKCKQTNNRAPYDWTSFRQSKQWQTSWPPVSTILTKMLLSEETPTTNQKAMAYE